MNEWRPKVTPLTKDEIMEAVKDDAWQRFRLSLKGISTSDKLRKLSGYLQLQYYKYGKVPRVEQVRVDNYINALLRGGQLVNRDGRILVQR